MTSSALLVKLDCAVFDAIVPSKKNALTSGSSSISTLTFGLVNILSALYPLMVVVGLLSSVAHPAHDAMIADILPEKQRQEGFGILRVVGNLSWIIGPTIGGVVANINFFYLFVIDAVISCVVAAIIFRTIPETKPEPHAHAESETLLQTVIGYRVVLKDIAFMAFMVAGMLMLIVYQQMYGTLSVYLRTITASTQVVTVSS